MGVAPTRTGCVILAPAPQGARWVLAPPSVKEGASMATRIYVGDLSGAATDQDLFAHFRPYGAVTECEVVVDQRSRQCRGFG
jgi:hypothetical protein